MAQRCVAGERPPAPLKERPPSSHWELTIFELKETREGEEERESEETTRPQDSILSTIQATDTRARAPTDSAYIL